MAQETKRPLEPTVLIPPPAPVASDEPQPYWVGTLPRCPVHVLHLSGVAIPRHHHLPVPRPDKPDVSTLTGPYRGAYLYLTREEMEKLKAATKTRVVRWGASLRDDKNEPMLDEKGVPMRKGMILDVRGGADWKYRAEKGDEPIAALFFVIPLAEVPLQNRIPGEKVADPPCFQDRWMSDKAA